MENGGGEYRHGDEVQSMEEEEDRIDLDLETQSMEEKEDRVDETPASATARLWPPANGQLPGRRVSASATKGGRGGSRAAAVPSAAPVAKRSRRPAAPASDGNGKRPEAVNVRRAAPAW
jgi:hypothetical protein